MKTLKPFLETVLDSYSEEMSVDDIIRISEFYQKRITNDNITQLFDGFEEKSDGWYLDGKTFVFSKEQLFDLEITVDMLASMSQLITTLENQGEQFIIKINKSVREDDK